MIRNFFLEGIFFNPNTSSPTQLFVSNTLISDNGSEAINIQAGGSGTMNGVIDHVEMENNGGGGLNAQTNTQTLNITASDSVAANNGGTGFAIGGGGPAANMMVRNCTSANNFVNGLAAGGTGTTLRVTRSTITGNFVGWLVTLSGGAVVSYGDNNIDGNNSVNTEPPGPLSYK